MKSLETAEWVVENESIVIAKIPFSDWMRMHNYPHRSPALTVRRARTNNYWNKLANGEPPTQAFLSRVTAALLQTDLYKLDGHARTVRWESGLLEKPEKVIVDIYRVNSMQEMVNLYNALHKWNKIDYKTITAACKAMDIQLKSDRFKRGFFMDALNLALRGSPRAHQDKRVHKKEIDTNKALAVFKGELELLDQLNPPKDVFVTGVIAAGLIMLGIKKEYLEFFRCLANKEGEIKDGRLNPVEALLSVIDKYRLRTQNPPAQQIDLCKRTIRALLAWEAGPDASGYWVKTILRTTDHMPYIREMNRVKGIVKDRDL